VRVSGLRNPDVIAKMAAVFESYWESGDFLPYDPVVFRERTQDVGGPRFELPPTELHLRPFQERLLEQVQLARLRGHHKNLICQRDWYRTTWLCWTMDRRLSSS
jgi:hypothetical protein